MINIDDPPSIAPSGVPVRDLPDDFARIAQVGSDYLTIVRKLGPGTRLLLRIVHDEHGIVFTVQVDIPGGGTMAYERLDYDTSYWRLRLDGRDVSVAEIPKSLDSLSIDDVNRVLNFTTR